MDIVYVRDYHLDFLQQLDLQFVFNTSFGVHHTQILDSLIHQVRETSTTRTHFLEAGTYRGQTPEYLLQRHKDVFVVTIDPFDSCLAGPMEGMPMCFEGERPQAASARLEAAEQPNSKEQRPVQCAIYSPTNQHQPNSKIIRTCPSSSP